MATNIFKLIFLLSIALFLSGSTYSQSEPAKSEKSSLKNNAFYASISPSIPYLATNIYYERIVYKSEKMAYFVRAGYGAYVVLMSGSGDFMIAQGGIITGVNKAHFEASLGATYFSTFDDGSIKKVLPAASAGYRRQKPGGHGIFRAGFGFPEFLYIGWGYSF